MKRSLGWVGLFVACAVLATGCSDDDSDAASEEAAKEVPAQTTSSSSNGGTEAPPAATPETESTPPDADDAFAAIVPTDTFLTYKTTIAGRGTLFGFRTDAIPGAVSYTFTASFGVTGTVPSNTIEILGSTDQDDESFVVSVYATNANGVNTQTETIITN